jgi:subtilase family serine protease
VKLRTVVAAVVTVSAMSASLLSAEDARIHHASPLFVVGPKAVRVASPKPGVVFSCQLSGSPINCYAPAEILTAYKIQALLDAGFTGTGKTIVIVDAFGNPTLQEDLAVFNAVFGLPAAKLNIIYPDGHPTFDPTNADQVGWSGEISLDVEMAHAVAPGATIDLVIAKSDEDADILSATKYAVAHHLGDVLSQSFGEDESCVDPTILSQQHQVFIQATLQNMTLFASTGDDGASQPTCDQSSYVKSASSPAVDPLVVAVGATSLTATQPDGNYVGERVWNDEFGASGGGYSVLFKKPFYQVFAVKGAKRGIPDVAYSGDVNNGVLVAWSQGDPTQVGSIYIFGGTSAGSPQWAALLALADEKAGYDLGFISQGLYLVGFDRTAYPRAFHDITVGNNSVEVTDSNGNPLDIAGFNAGPGWDATTGLGSPKGINFVDNLLRYVSPFDGLIGIAEGGPLSSQHVSSRSKQLPH